MTWVASPWGIVVSYVVAAFVVFPLAWWAVMAPRRRSERALEQWEADRRARRDQRVAALSADLERAWGRMKADERRRSQAAHPSHHEPDK